MSKFTFFWNGPFSNWYPAPFNFMGIRFATSEQFMMLGKALLFADERAARQVMSTPDPRENKKTGRSVQGFDKARWDKRAKDIVYVGCHAKFTMNPKLLDKLLATAGTELVEASPVDTVWGIGLAENDPRAQDKATWRGTNWLGEVLTDLRDDITASTVKPTPGDVMAWFTGATS